MPFSTALAAISVLLVEPSPTQAKLVEKMLTRIGVKTVHYFQTGEEALAALTSVKQATVVISSLYLPDMAGTDLVLAMRLQPELETIPFILVSSETHPQKLEPVRQSGACSIVAKPFTEEQLSRAICTAADYLNPPSDLGNEDIDRLHVLLVEDSTASRKHIHRLLRELGITRISEAANGKEAMHFLQDSMVDLVITDYNMPEMDGYELTRYIRNESWQSQIPILMVTSEKDEGRLAAVQKAGVSSICDKPFDVNTINRLIAEAMEH